MVVRVQVGGSFWPRAMSRQACGHHAGGANATMRLVSGLGNPSSQPSSRTPGGSASAPYDVIIIEVGGTVGEYENVLFMEAIRMMKQKSPADVATVMLSYVPIPSKVGEMKTKPTQNAVSQMNSYGVHPNIIIARADVSVDKKRKEKIANMSGLYSADDVISAPNVKNIYDVPINFENDGLSNRILKYFGLSPKKKDLKDWNCCVGVERVRVLTAQCVSV